MQWFSNRGQIIQVACAVLGVFITLMVWLAVPAQSFIVYAAPVIVSVVVGFIASHALKSGSPIAKAAHIEKPITLIEKPVSVSAVPPTKAISKLGYEIHSETAPVGKRIEFSAAGRRFAVVVHGIKTKQKVLKADVQIVEGSGPVSGGPSTEQLGPARLLLPITSSKSHLEEAGAFGFERFENYLSFFILNVHHIDPHSKEVTYTVCVSKSLVSLD